MILMTVDDLRKLTTENEPPCISIYMPTVRAGDEIRQNPIRLKNLVREAEDLLTAQGFRSPTAKALLEPAYELIHDEIFWQNQSDGFALFLSGDTTRYYQVPLDFQERVVIANNFHIKPLLPLFSNNGRFFILALSQNEVRLLEGTHYSVDEVDLRDVPESLADALQWDDPEEQLQHHASEGPSTTGEKVGMFHGHGVGTDDQKTNILRYFQAVDKGLSDLLAEENTPLVLAGVEYLLPIYREANSYQYIIDEVITGNPEELSEKELHARAWKLVEPVFREQQNMAVATYQQVQGDERTSDDITEIVQAAFYSRVGQLFVARSMVQWGTFDPDEGRVELLEEVSPEAVDLLDLAVVLTFQNGGEVYVVEPDEVPSRTTIAAVYRWPSA